MKLFDLERIVANKYNHLLVMLFLFILCSPFYDEGERAMGVGIITLVLLLAIIICLRVTVQSVIVFWVCVGIAGFGLFLDAVGHRLKVQEISNALEIGSHLIYCFFLGLAITALMKHMFRSRRVKPDMIVGGICVYLLIGILWTLVYMCVNTLDEGAVILGQDRSFLYFSFTTLTTLGYGDFVPMSEFARVLTNFEAICGQMYLAIFVARLVGLHTAWEIRQASERHELLGKDSY